MKRYLQILLCILMTVNGSLFLYAEETVPEEQAEEVLEDELPEETPDPEEIPEETAGPEEELTEEEEPEDEDIPAEEEEETPGEEEKEPTLTEVFVSQLYTGILHREADLIVLISGKDVRSCGDVCVQFVLIAPYIPEMELIGFRHGGDFFRGGLRRGAGIQILRRGDDTVKRFHPSLQCSTGLPGTTVSDALGLLHTVIDESMLRSAQQFETAEDA